MAGEEMRGYNDSNEQELTKKGTSFTEDLKLAMQDHHISSEEAKILAQYEQELRNLKSQTRKEWRELALDIRKDFQKTIGAKDDGAMGKETIDKLIEKSSSDMKSNVITDVYNVPSQE